MLHALHHQLKSLIQDGTILSCCFISTFDSTIIMLQQISRLIRLRYDFLTYSYSSKIECSSSHSTLTAGEKSL